ncbi:MAG: TolC family protein [Spongiibacteraceae bacterium]
MNDFYARAARACFIVGYLLVSAASSAEQRSVVFLSQALTLTQAIEAAMAHNPELRSSTFALRAADARITQADIAPNPELAVQLENFGGTGSLRGNDALETTFMLSQVIELGDKRAHRTQVAHANRALLGVETEARQLDILAEVTRRFIHVAADQEALKLTQRATLLAEETLRAVEKRVRAARSPSVEQHRANIALTRARIDEEHAEHELDVSRRKLAAMWGDTEAEFDSVSADLFVLPSPARFEDLLAKLKTNPDFTRFASEQRLRDAEVRVAESRRIPSVQIGAGIRQLQETDDHAFVMSFSMPLFSSSRNNGAVAEASAKREQVDADKNAAFIRAQAQLFELYQELKHSLTEATVLREQVFPQSESILRDTEYAYQRGRYSYQDLIAAQRELLDAQRAQIEAAANAHRFFAEIERLTGETLSQAQNTAVAY